MRPARQSIRPGDHHRRTVLTDWLSRAVRLPERRRSCTPEVVWRVVLFAAAFTRSVVAACAAIVSALSGQAVWDCLRATWPKRRTLKGRLLPALHATRQAEAIRAGAIDDHRIAYFGEPSRDTTWAKETAGTHAFHTRATVYIVGAPDRYMLGQTVVGEKEPLAAVLTRLLEQVGRREWTIRAVLLDKAFFSIAVMQRLQSRGLPFMIPTVIRGRKPRIGVKAVGLRARRRRGACRCEYTHENRGVGADSGRGCSQGLPAPPDGASPEREVAVRDVAGRRAIRWRSTTWTRSSSGWRVATASWVRCARERRRPMA